MSAPTTTTKSAGAAGTKKLSAPSWLKTALYALVAITLVVMANAFLFKHPQTYAPGSTAVVASQPQTAAPYGCRGAEPTMSVTTNQMVLPTNCFFDVDVLTGVLIVQGKDGRQVEVRPGKRAEVPAGFIATRFWSVSGATINPTFTAK